MKRRILSVLMALALMLGCIAIPAAAAETPQKTLKVLAIGNSWSNDATSYLADIFKAEGYDIDLTVGRLYVSGQSIKGHWEYAQNNKSYIYYKNTDCQWTTVGDYTIDQALQDEDWDIITLQQSGSTAGIPSSFNSDLDNVVDFINKYKPAKAKLYWHSAWSFERDHDSSLFLSNFNQDQVFLFECIINTIKQQILTRPAFQDVIPSGTALQNTRATVVGDDLHRDGSHLNTMGRVVVGYTWYCKLTGKTLDNAIRYTDVREESSTPAITITPEQAQAIAQSVNAAIADPFGGVRPFYAMQDGDVFYMPYPPQANQPADAYVFGSDTVADGTKVIFLTPKDTETEENNNYAAQFWYADGGKLIRVASTEQCGGYLGLHDVITAADGKTVTLDDGTHKGPASCTLGQVGACGGETRSTAECAAQLALADKVAIVDLRAAVLYNGEAAAADVAAIKALCDEGKAVVNTYAPNGTAQAFVVQDHTIKITAEQPENVALKVDTKDGWNDEDGVAYANIGFKASFSLPEGAEYQLDQAKLDGENIKNAAFFVKGNHTLSATVKKVFQGDVYYLLEPMTQGQECEAIVLHSTTLPLGITKVVPPNGSGSKTTAHHFFEMMDVEKNPLKRFAGMWVAYTNRYRYGVHDVISVYDMEGKAVTLACPPDSHYSKATCNYTKASGYDLPGYYEEKCGESTSRGYECAAYLKLADDLKIYDLRGDVLAGLVPAAATVPEIKALCDEGKVLVNTFTLDGTKSAGTASAFILIDAQPFMTRGEAVQALYEQSGKPAVTAEAKFSDVAADNAYVNAVAWAAETGLVSGYGDGTFGVNDNITVEQLAVMLWNKAGKTASSASFNADVTRSDWATAALNWCSQSGVLENVTFEKANFTATRTHIFRMLVNAK